MTVYALTDRTTGEVEVRWEKPAKPADKNGKEWLIDNGPPVIDHEVEKVQAAAPQSTDTLVYDVVPLNQAELDAVAAYKAHVYIPLRKNAYIDQLKKRPQDGAEEALGYVCDILTEAVEALAASNPVPQEFTDFLAARAAIKAAYPKPE
jgi:hypothetical protein